MEGEAVEQNYAQAFTWFHKASEQHYQPAQYHLGLMYYHGWGVEQDIYKAYAWVFVAAENNHTQALVTLGKIRSELDESQLQKANNLGRRYCSRYGG